MLGLQPSDVRSLTDLAAYLNCDSRGHDGRHERISSWFYWCWNANSGDTGGLVQDDWTSLEWVKLAFLTTLGLKPWASDSVSLHLCIPPACRFSDALLPVADFVVLVPHSCTALLETYGPDSMASISDRRRSAGCRHAVPEEIPCFAGFPDNLIPNDLLLCYSVQVAGAESALAALQAQAAAPAQVPQQRQTAVPPGVDSQPAGELGSSSAPAARAAAARPSASQCSVSMRLGSGWRQGNDFAVDVNLAVTNIGTELALSCYEHDSTSVQ